MSISNSAESKQKKEAVNSALKTAIKAEKKKVEFVNTLFEKVKDLIAGLDELQADSYQAALGAVDIYRRLRKAG